MLNIFVFLSLATCIFSLKLEEFDACEKDDQCNVGLVCDIVCKEDNNAPRCFKKNLDARRLIKSGALDVTFPSCEENGNYKPVQCGESNCYCSDEYGYEISGFNTPIQLRAKKYCNCASDKAKNSQIKTIQLSYNCDKFGNYEKVQCPFFYCFCVDDNGKKLASSQYVYITDREKLKCD